MVVLSCIEVVVGVLTIIGGTQEGCVGGEKINLLGLPSFIDLQGQPLGSIKNIFFFNNLDIAPPCLRKWALSKTKINTLKLIHRSSI